MSDSHDKAITMIERHVDRTMSPLVAQGLKILQESPNPETLAKLLEVQQQWEANEARKAFAIDMVGLKRDMPTVVGRDATVDFTNKAGQRTHYNHASLAGILDTATPHLTQHGFSLAWTPSTSKDGVTVTCRITHRSGHFQESTLSGPPDASGGKNTLQSIASAITLLERYTAQSLLGIATRDMKEPAGERDDDHEPDPDSVDSARNMAGVGKLKRKGRTVEQAETYLDKPIDTWTSADLARLQDWAKPAPKDEELA